MNREKKNFIGEHVNYKLIRLKNNPSTTNKPKSILIKSNMKRNNKSKRVTFSDYCYFDITEKEYDTYKNKIKHFDSVTYYYLGDIKLEVKFGDNYYDYLRGKDTISHFVIENRNFKFLIGYVRGVLKKYCSNNLYYWYFCDLVIGEKYGGKGLLYNLCVHMIHKVVMRANRGYCIVDADKNGFGMMHVIQKLDYIVNIKVNRLLIYSVSVMTMGVIERFFTCAFGDIKYLFLDGIKQWIILETGKVMKVYHLHHGSDRMDDAVVLDDIVKDNDPDVCIMFCFPENSTFKTILTDLGIIETKVANIVSWRMDFFDWHQILTSDF